MKRHHYFLRGLFCCTLLGGIVHFQQAEAAGKPETSAGAMASGQEFHRFYVDVSMGYAFRLGNPEVNSVWELPLAVVSEMFKSVDCPNVGRGLRVGVNLGVNFNKYIGLELNGGYVALPVNLISSNWSGVVPEFTGGVVGIGGAYDTRMELESQRGYLALQMKVSPGFRQCNPYAKVGVGTIFGSLKHDARLFVSEGDMVVADSWFVGSDAFCLLGFVGALGLDVNLNTRTSLFVEWQAGVYSTFEYDWTEGEQWGSEGEAQLKVDGVEDLFGNCHGLNIGVKFKF